VEVTEKQPGKGRGEAAAAASPDDDVAMRKLAAGLGVGVGSVAVADCAWGHRGVVTTRTVGKGETVLQCPAHALLSVRAVKATELVQSSFVAEAKM
jgi:hypothetical protein